MSRRRLLAAAPLLAAALWGGMYVVSKWGFGTIPPLTLAFLRVSLGASVLFVAVRRTRPDRRFSRKDWRGFTVLAGWLTAALTTQFVGTDLTTASQGALLTVLTPVFVLTLGVTALDESLTRAKVGGTVLAAAGTVLVVVEQYDLEAMTAGSAVGVVLLIVSSFTFAAFTVYGKPLVRRYSALEAVTYATVVSVPMFALFVPLEFLYADLHPAVVLSWASTPAVVGAIAYLGVFSTAVAWYCWYKGMEYTDASTIAVFFFAQPAVGILLGVLVLGETVDLGFIGGGILLSVGVYVVNRDGEAPSTDTRHGSAPNRGS